MGARPMRLEGIELVRVAIPFREEVGTATGVHRVRDLLFVRVATSEGDGWGECAALGDRTAVDPNVTEVEEAAVALGVARLCGASATRDGALPTGPEVAPLFGSAAVDRMLAATFEMAVSDAELRASGTSMAESLGTGAGFETMPVGAAIGIPLDRDLDRLRAAVDRAVGQGLSRIRLKVEPGWLLEPVAAVRADHASLALQVDANGSFSAGDAPMLSRLADYDVICVEQPLPPADLVAQAELARALPVPVCLDETLSSPRRVIDALRYGACAMACLKPGRLGGVRATRAAHAACTAAGVPAFVGGFFETGLGRSSNLALAARLAQDASGLVSDLNDPSDYLVTDPCGYPPVVEGWVRVPGRPGVGSAPDPAVLDGLGARRRWFPATYT